MNSISTACIAGIVTAAALLIATRPAHAGDIAYAPNQANGAIVLTDDVGQCAQGSYSYYTTDAGGKATFGGCFMFKDAWVYARSADGQSHQYMLQQFTETEYFKTRYLSSSKSSM